MKAEQRLERGIYRPGNATDCRQAPEVRISKEGLHPWRVQGEHGPGVQPSGPRTLRKCVSVVSSSPVCGTLLQQSQETSTGGFLTRESICEQRS